MKRKIILLLIMLILTGCKVEYKINLTDNLALEENAKLIAITEEDKIKFNDFSLNVPIDKYVDNLESFQDKISTLEYYNITKEDGKINFDYKYTKDNYETYIDSTLANMAYDYISISKVEETTLVLSTGKEFMLFDSYENLDEVRVTINTKYKVITNNADEVNKHSYTWIITKENAYGKGIYLKVDTSEEDLTFYEKLVRGDYFNIFTLSIIVVLISLLIFIFFKKYSEKQDAI